MKTLRVPLALLLLTGSLAFGQTPAPEAAAAAENAPAPVLRAPQELEQLVAPIALYPDALIAIILPATTASTDIVLAARHLRDFPDDKSQIEHRAWDESVKSLTNYPDVLKWMDENLQWVKQVGEAFAVQPADVMQAVQRLRAQARAAGTLTDTPQQQVIAEPDVIRIVPAQPDVIYVPSYDPEVVFVDRPVYYPYPRPFLTFGVGVPVGSWLAFDCDWRHRTIWVGNRHRHWSGHDWHRPLVPFGAVYAGPRFTRPAGVHPWRPPPVTFRSSVTVVRRTPPPIVRPSHFNFAATRGQGPRPTVAEIRPSPALQTQPIDTTSSRTSAPGSRRDGSRNFGARTGNPTPGANVLNVPGMSAAPAVTPSPAAPATEAPAPAPRRGGYEWSRDRENRGYAGPRQPGSNATTPSPSVTPIAPVTTFAPPGPVPSATAPAPTQRRGGFDGSRERDSRGHTYPRNLGNNAAALSSPPVANTPVPSASPAPARTYSRPHYNPPTPGVSAPAPVSRQPAPVAAPAPQAPAPQTQPARSDNASGSGYRGHRNRNEN